ncbi:MAG: hypothetical protein A2942_04350 [Candidatus Lloydbacteria bacterium RIFCSPLOWO2_01_FULL_50_20]|uniref:Uncharacterized protein n=1 Tax=Candidatus Lloydbacteria bacterium RIFCSPLOWO2_01_FULL_50_20 TaxID=1798665 RepID=A0A1G2DF00_9BACT|nr:MAG: hypothetical protein A3C13_02945 [Candidatus Lloydbacteria bacterium RIFCSPHIGHO2_02_FULL_50_11]OGZ11450.1 MAG: hypothetical protein A2942_04350 [Candidatus Lloydbacteria bacterium RIFCSPLOWO2_01_FULL_50_20]
MRVLSKLSIGVLCVFAFLTPAVLFAAVLSAGIPKESLWFSKDPFLDGDQIVISVPLYNSSEYRFSGIVELQDGMTMIGKVPFILPSGVSQIFTFPWKATSGEHNFSVAITGEEFFFKDKSLLDQPSFDGISGVIRRSVAVKQIIPALDPAVSPLADDPADEETPVTQYLSMKIPESIAKRVMPAIEGIEQFRVNQAERANSMKNEILEELSRTMDTSEKSSSGWGVFTGGVAKGDIIYSPWQYAKLFFVLCYEFLTENIYAFYMLCAYILYQIIRFATSFFS